MRPIDADLLKIKIKLKNAGDPTIIQLYETLIKWIDCQPTVEKTGHWVKIGDRGLGFSETVICKCSECEFQKEFAGKFDGHNLIVDMERAYNYCPNCGAKMESEDNNEQKTKEKAL